MVESEAKTIVIKDDPVNIVGVLSHDSIIYFSPAPAVWRMVRLITLFTTPLGVA